MPFKLKCPSCGQSQRVPDDALGQKLNCTTCGATFRVPSSRPPTPAPDPSSAALRSPTAAASRRGSFSSPPRGRPASCLSERGTSAGKRGTEPGPAGFACLGLRGSRWGRRGCGCRCGSRGHPNFRGPQLEPIPGPCHRRGSRSCRAIGTGIGSTSRPFKFRETSTRVYQRFRLKSAGAGHESSAGFEAAGSGVSRQFTQEFIGSIGPGCPAHHGADRRAVGTVGRTCEGPRVKRYRFRCQAGHRRDQCSRHR